MSFPAAASVQVLDAHPDAHFLLDEAGTLLHANRAALRLMLCAAEAVLNTPLTRWVAESAEQCEHWLHQGRRSTTPTPISLHLRCNPGPDLACRGEIARLASLDGVGPACMWLRLVPEGQGNAPFLQLNQRIESLRQEVSRRKDAEAELLRQSEWLQTVLVNVAEGVVATDLHGQVLLMNEAASRLIGVAVADALHRPAGMLFTLVADADAPEQDASAVQALSALLRGADATVAAGRMQLLTSGNPPCKVYASAAPLYSESGRPGGAVLVLRSVEAEVRAENERRSLEHQLRQTQKMEAIGTLAGGIAHDFNNVIAAIIGNAELARMDLAPEHVAQQPLQQIQRASERARALVRQILAFSRRDRQSLQRHALQPLVEEAVGLLRGTLPARVKLEVRCTDEPVYALVDAGQIQQVVMNLCTNAWHALPPEGGEVQLTLGRESPDGTAPSMACLRVIDNGCGMDEATRERIFEPFFTTKPTGQGTGLGLAVVHGIVAEHRGTLQVDSAPGRGSTFTVRLPALSGAGVEGPGTATAAVSTPSPVAAPPGAAQPARHVVYVDDDELMRSTVERLLRRRGFTVSSFGSAAALLDALGPGGQAFDLVVTDYNMPDASGLDLARQLRGLYPALPVVITSGNISAELRQGARALGHIRLLNKEECFERLASVIADVFSEGSAPAPSA
ncbi:MAG: ATP-binding protein [Hydrogenophaga sp.]